LKKKVAQFQSIEPRFVPTTTRSAVSWSPRNAMRAPFLASCAPARVAPTQVRTAHRAAARALHEPGLHRAAGRRRTSSRPRPASAPTSLRVNPDEQPAPTVHLEAVVARVHDRAGNQQSTPRPRRPAPDRPLARIVRLLSGVHPVRHPPPRWLSAAKEGPGLHLVPSQPLIPRLHPRPVPASSHAVPGPRRRRRRRSMRDPTAAFASKYPGPAHGACRQPPRSTCCRVGDLVRQPVAGPCLQPRRRRLRVSQRAGRAPSQPS
jgi:hypothetical protein